MEQDLDRILIPRDRIRLRVEELGRQIAATYGENPEGLVIVAILSGAIIFLADLIRCLPFKMKLGMMTISRYRGATTVGGDTQLVQNLTIDISGRDVLLVDDILDSGHTLREVKAELMRFQPASLRSCVLLRKTAKAPKDLNADFVGFEIEDVFVVGYGLDYDGQYRNWPDIGVLRPELYA
jgi:hypoxanthine phosphoribosyltransferase